MAKKIRNRIDRLNVVLSQNKYDVARLTEYWITDKDNPNTINIRGCSFSLVMEENVSYLEGLNLSIMPYLKLTSYPLTNTKIAGVELSRKSCRVMCLHITFRKLKTYRR